MTKVAVLLYKSLEIQGYKRERKVREKTKSTLGIVCEGLVLQDSQFETMYYITFDTPEDYVHAICVLEESDFQPEQGFSTDGLTRIIKAENVDMVCTIVRMLLLKDIDCHIKTVMPYDVAYWPYNGGKSD